MKLKVIREGMKDFLHPERIVEKLADDLETLQEKMYLKRFFAVTTTSLYEVFAKGEDGYPYVRKIKLRGKSKVPVGGTFGGDLLAVCKWLQFFIPEKYGVMSPMTGIERRVEMVNTQYWLGKTSPIIALFLNDEKARGCFASSDLKPCDPRWLKDTKEVIEVIGEKHPTITICHWRDLALLP